MRIKPVLTAARGLAAATVRAVSGSYAAHGRLEEADCILAYAFGFHRGPHGRVLPGDVNVYLAGEVIRRHHGKPVIAQFEIADALRLAHGYEAFARIEADDRSYLDTRTVAVKAAEIMRRHGWTTAMVIAQAHHLPRADIVTRAIGMDTVVPAGIRPVWDRRSEQSWTRSRASWAAREPLVIAYYALKGWLAR